MSAICLFQLGIIAGRINDRQTSGTVRRQSSSLYFLTIMLFAHRLIQFHRNFKKTRCNVKPDCSPPDYPSRRLLIIAIGQLAGLPAFNAALALPVVSRRRRTQSCGLKKCGRRRCIGVVNKTHRRSTSCIILTTVERVVAECTKFITLWSP